MLIFSLIKKIFVLLFINVFLYQFIIICYHLLLSIIIDCYQSLIITPLINQFFDIDFSIFDEDIFNNLKIYKLIKIKYYNIHVFF